MRLAMPEIKVFSPAKINLFLEVFSQREDGYHEIETLLQAIDLHDEIILRDRKEGIKIICSQEGVPPGKKNLAYQAAEIILKETHLQKGVEIEIKKKIPLAAGLGGGSSNAAAVLVGLRKLWNLSNLSEEKLENLGEKLGMDVPFFIKGGRALGKGRGEELISLKGWEPFWLTLVVPDFKVSTAWAYQGIESLTRKEKQFKISPDNLKICSGREGSLFLYNRLEEITENKFPWVKKVKKRLQSLGGTALMSGSGPTVFGIFPARHSAEKAGAMITQELINRSGSEKREKIYITKTFSGGVSLI